MDTSLEARKAPPEEVAPKGVGGEKGAASLFALLPEVCWKQVAAFAAPPDIYNLCLSSKIFFSDGISTDEERKPAANNRGGSDSGSDDVPMMTRIFVDSRGILRGTRHRAQTRAAKKAKTSSKKGSKGEAPLLATRLLRESLLSSLGRVLENSKSGITLESALALSDLPEGSVLIAGSSMAQACLGVQWKNSGRYNIVSNTDVDVYCTAKAAPLVRSWLVESANAIFTGFNDGYIDIVDDRLLYTVDTKFHHVECWSSVFDNIHENLQSGGGMRRLWGEKTIGDALREGTSTVTVQDIKNSKHYKDMVQWGANCMRNYVDWKWQCTTPLSALGVPLGKAYDIVARGDLPFDFDGDKCIDLIVGIDGKDLKAADLLDDFDLALCKCSFDGKKFRIPEPHLTFNRKTTMEPQRRAIVESYLKHFTPPPNSVESPTAASMHISNIIEKVRKELPHVPTRFFRNVDVAARTSYVAAYESDIYNHGDPRFQAKYGPATQMHNWIRKLVKRLRKYQGRVISVVGAPIVGDDVKIDKVHICPL